MTHKYDPDYAVHPGETVKECMAMHGETPHSVAVSFGTETTDRRVTETLCDEITGICCGCRDIEQKHALAFSLSFRNTMDFWLDRQAKYDERVKAAVVGTVIPVTEDYRRGVTEIEDDQLSQPLDERVMERLHGIYPDIDVDVPMPPVAPPKPAEPIKPTVVMVDWLLGKGWDLQKDKDLGHCQWRSPDGVSGDSYKVWTMDVFPQPVIDFIRKMLPCVDIPIESTIDQMEILIQNGWHLSYREESRSFAWRLINFNMGGPAGESFAGLDHHTVRLSEFPPEVNRYLREHARKRKDNA